MAVAGTVAAVGILVRSGGRFGRSRAGDEKEVSQVRDAGTAEVREAESHDSGLVILVACGRVVVVIVCVRADLDSAEGNLRPGIHVAEPVGANEGIDIVYQSFLRPCAECKCYSQN